MVREQLEETDDVRDGRIIFYGELDRVPVGALSDISLAGDACRSLAAALTKTISNDVSEAVGT